MSDQTATVTGVTKVHARRAVRYLRNRGILSFHRAADKSLNAFVTKHGMEWTDKALRDALAATAR